MKNVLFIGLGAIGTSIASQFSNAQYNFSVLCDTPRKERYQQNGFIVNNKRYDFHYVTNKEYENKADLIIISVKYHHLKVAIKQLAGLVGENTMIISLLNGIDSEEIIAKQFGHERVIYAYIYNIDATKVQNVITYSKKGIIVFGEKDGSATNRIDRLKGILTEAEISHEVSNDIIRNMWWKFMVNIGMNQTTAILRAPYRTIQKISYAQKLVKAAMREAIEISKSLNINLSEEDIDKSFNMLMDFSPDGKTSMLQDVEAKRKTEVEMLSGKLCLLGEQFNIPTPVNHLFFNLIKSIEKMY